MRTCRSRCCGTTGTPPISSSSNSTIITEADNTSKSVFGQVNAFVTDRLELIGGLRYSDDTQYYNRIALPGPPLPPGTDRIGPPAASNEYTGKAGREFPPVR